MPPQVNPFQSIFSQLFGTAHAQQRDDFEPDDFEPDDFEPDAPQEKSWLDRIWTSPTEEAQAKGLQWGSNRGGHDTRMFSIDSEPASQRITDTIAMSKYIPEWMKPGLATAADWNLVQIPKGIGEFFSTAEGVATPGAVRAMTRGPQVLPPTQRMLPLPREGNINPVPRNRTFVGGQGGVQARGAVRTPVDEARLLGYDFDIDPVTGNPIPAGRPSQPAGTAMEIPRPAEPPFYTAHEQQGGTSLEIPESERYLRGTELGTRPVSGAGQPTEILPPIVGDTLEAKLARSRRHPSGTPDLPYPLNVVPEAVRPRSDQEVRRALAPTEMQEPPAMPREPVTFENEPTPPVPQLTPPRPQLPGSVPVNQDVLLPSAIIKMRNARQNSGLNITPDTVSRVPPEAQPAVQAMIEGEAKTPRGWNVYDTLARQSPELATKAKRSVQVTRQYLQAWVPDLENALNRLTKEQKTNFGAYVEGALPITSPKVQAAVDVWRRIESAIGDKATDVGLRLYNDSNKWVPFMKNTDNYWPHIPIDPAEPKLLDRLVASGMPVSEAKKVVNYYRKTGEIIVGAQHARAAKSNVPYRLDADAAIAHIYSMAKRISQHEHFGPMDVAGKGAEGIADIIRATPDRTLTNKLMERILGRDEAASTRATTWLDRARRFSAITHLQNFAIPNIILGNASTAQKAGIYWKESLKEISKLVSSRYRQDLATSGIWQSFQHTIAEDMAKMRDIHGIGKGETFNRAIAGAVGKAVARQAHKELRDAFLSNTKTGIFGFGTKSKVATAELGELVLEDVNKLIRQDKLTDAQLKMAAGRMAERTQGLNVPGNLPYSWSTPPNDPWRFGGQLVLQFKKMGYQATKNVKDTIDPRRVGWTESAKAIGRWIAVAGVAGELVGDVKAGLRGIWSPRDEQDERVQRWLEGQGISRDFIDMVSRNAGVPDYVVARLFDNYQQAFFLGLPADLYTGSTYGPLGLLGAIAGPTFGDMSKYAYYIGTGNLEGVGKEATKMLPIPGSQGIAESLFPSDR